MSRGDTAAGASVACRAAAITVIAASLAVETARLARLHDWADLPFANGSDELRASLALLGATKAALAAWLFRGAGARRWIARAFAALAGAEVLRAGGVLLPPGAFVLPSGWLPALLDPVLDGAVAIALGLLVGLAYLGVGTAIVGSREPANGYSLPLVIGSYAVCVAAALVVVDTLTHLALMFFDLSLLGFVLSTGPGRGRGLALTTPARLRTFVAIGFVLPLAGFAGSAGLALASLAGANRGLLTDIVERRSTPMEEVATWSGARTHLPAAARALHERAAFNDVWMTDPEHAFAVDRNALYESRDGGRTWRRTRELRVPGIEVRFAADGRRGWTGDPSRAVELTRDGGASWQRLDLVAVYREHAGEAAGGSLGYDSLLHLDPDSGNGSMVMGCGLLATADFARSWRLTRITRPDGKRLCLAPRPLALDETAGLALVTTLGAEVLYRRDPGSGEWERRCGLDEDALLLAGEVCAGAALSAAERGFMERLEAEDVTTGRIAPDPDAVHRILAGEPPTAAVRARRTGPDHRWLSAPGLLLTSRDGGREWAVHQHVPALTTLHPVDAQRAVGWDRSLQAYVTGDGGGVWLPLDDDGLEVLDLHFDPHTRSLWMLLDGALVRVDVESGERQRSFTFAAGERPEVLRLSADGRRIWARAHDAAGVHLSRDGGERWHRLTSGPAARGIVDVHCPADAACVAALDDGAVVRLREAHDAPAPEPAGWLPEAAREQPGYLLGSGDALVFVPEEGRLAFASDDGGASWRARPLATEQLWSRPLRSTDGSSFIVPGEAAMVMVEQAAARWSTVSPAGWETPLDFCWSPSGRIVYLHDGNYLAWTFDRGESWRRTTVRTGVPPFCGFGREHLWLQLDGVAVYHVPPDT